MIKNLKIALLFFLLALAVFVHGFYYDWLEFVKVDNQSTLVMGRKNIKNAKQRQELLSLLDKVDDYKIKETQHLIIHYPADAAYTEESAKDMEDAYKKVNSFFNIDRVKSLGRKIHFVYAPGETREDDKRLREILGYDNYIQGISKGDIGIIYSIFSYTPHELNHVVARGSGRPNALLSEGFANYFNKIDWERNVRTPMKQIMDKGVFIPLEKMAETSDFRNQPSAITYREAAVFVKYLIDTYGKDKFIELYLRTDYNCTQEKFISLLEEIYDKEFAVLDREWKSFIYEEIRK